MSKIWDWVVAIGGIIILAVFLILSFTGSKWELTKKNWATTRNSGLERVIEVKDALTGSLIWTYEGRCYIDNKSKAGDISIIYYDSSGNAKKADFMGSMIILSSVEK